MKHKQTKAVFLDSDGVLNKVIMRDNKPSSPRTLDELEIPLDVKPGLVKLESAGYVLICVTNKPDVERGNISVINLDTILNTIRQKLPLNDMFVCYDQNSDCYKPKPGMLLEAAKKYNIDLSKSFIIGDRWRDIGAGHNAKCRTIWIDRGYSEKKPDPEADFTVSNFSEAVNIILAQS